MPKRVYFCTNDDCDNEYEKEQGFNEVDKVCEKCGSAVFQDLSNIYTRMGSPKTVGSLAERNASKFGDSRLKEIEAKQEKEFEKKRAKEREQLQEKVPGIKFVDKKKEKPWFGELPKTVKKEIFNKTGEDQRKRVEKYINEGK